MAIASLFGVVALPIVLIGILLPVALVVALQVWLCKRKNRWLGADPAGAEPAVQPGDAPKCGSVFPRGDFCRLL